MTDTDDLLARHDRYADQASHLEIDLAEALRDTLAEVGRLQAAARHVSATADFTEAAPFSRVTVSRSAIYQLNAALDAAASPRPAGAGDP